MTIAVVIPAHNEAAFIGDILATLQAQTRLPDEIIVVCDRCTDDTAARAEDAFAAFPPSVRCAAVPADVGGIAGARNVGIYASTSEILVCVDADTRLHPAVLQFVEQSGEDGTVLGGFWMVPDSRYKRTLEQWILNRLWIGGINFCACVLQNFVGTGCFFRRDLGLLYDEEWGWGEDIEFCNRVKRAKKGETFCILGAPLVYCDRRFIERGYRQELGRRLANGIDHLRRSFAARRSAISR